MVLLVYIAVPVEPLDYDLVAEQDRDEGRFLQTYLYWYCDDNARIVICSSKEITTI